MRRNVGEIAAAVLEGRAPGSQGEAEAASFVTEKFLEAGLDMLSPEEGQVFGIARSAGDTLVSRNVIAYIPGYDKSLKDHYIVIGARLDNLGPYTVTQDGATVEKIRYGANGNASGLAMMIELAGKLGYTVKLVARAKCVEDKIFAEVSPALIKCSNMELINNLLSLANS